MESTIEEANTYKTGLHLLEKIKDIHEDMRLCGEPRNALLNAHDDLLLYLLYILRGDAHLPPEVSIDEWKKLLNALRSHWILPLFYYKICHFPQEFRPPAEILDMMRQAFMSSRIRSIEMEKQLSVMLNAFQRAGIDILIIKGPALAWSIYPDPATRPSSDLDILVKPSQVERAGVLLQELGYKCLTKRFRHFLKDIYKDESFVPPGNTHYLRSIELHWDLYHLHGKIREVGIEDLFQRAVELKTSSLKMSILHPVDALMYASINIRNHILHNRLTWIYDTALLAERLSKADDWKILQQRCVEWQCRNDMETALKLACNWSGIYIPFGFDDFSQWPEPSAVESARHRVHGMRHEWFIDVIKVFRLDSISSIFSMIACVFFLLFPSTDYIRTAYPPSRSWLLPLSYMKRWLKWIRKK